MASDIVVRSRLSFGVCPPLPIAPSSVGGGELWLVLVLVALVLLLAEWWTYHRRMTV